MPDYPQACGCILREEPGPCDALYLIKVCATHADPDPGPRDEGETKEDGA